MLTQGFVEDLLAALDAYKKSKPLSSAETVWQQTILDMCQSLGMQAYLSGTEEGLNMALSGLDLGQNQAPPFPHFEHPDNHN